MGGTHIDGVGMQDGRVVRTHKRMVDRDDLFGTIWTTLEEIVQDFDVSQIRRINLSTTISTNAIVEQTTPDVGMLVQTGPGILHDFSSCRGPIVNISGYVDHRGVVVEPLQTRELEQALALFEKEKVGSCAVISKFSTRNPDTEIAIGKRLGERFGQVSLGHRMSGALNFPRRVYTSYLNSAVSSLFHTFLDQMKKSLKKKGIDAPLYILKADAGTMDERGALYKPVETILSGPAASFLGMSALIPSSDDAILLDVGGTTTDIFFLSDGVPLFEPLGATISEYRTLVRAVYSVSIGLGGDSSIRMENNSLVIGPQRKDRAYAFGGKYPTPTDAMIVLGLIKVGQGEQSKAKEAMTILGEAMKLETEEVAQKILDTMAGTIKHKTDELLTNINSKPVYTMKELLHGKKVQPTTVHIIGGPAQALAPALEKAYGLPCKYPKGYSVANAIGAALAKPTVEITLLADTALRKLSVPELGIYESVSRSFTLQDAKTRAVKLLKEAVVAMGSEDVEIEIPEESSFTMVEGFSTTGKNIRIKAQVKPGLITELRSDTFDES